MARYHFDSVISKVQLTLYIDLVGFGNVTFLVACVMVCARMACCTVLQCVAVCCSVLQCAENGSIPL